MATNQSEIQSDNNIENLSKILSEHNVTAEKLIELICQAKDSEKKAPPNISKLELYCNSNEQYVRNWAVRIHGLSVPSDLVKEVGADEACMATAYNAVIEPVLRKLTPKPEVLDVNTKWGPEKLDCVPKCFNLLSNGHFVGKKQNNQPRTIIIRFVSRYMRNLFLRYKRHFMPNPTAAEATMGVKYYSAYPDLTARNHKYLLALKEDARVKAAWAFDGNIRFSLADSKGQAGNTEAEHSEVFFVDDIRMEPTAVVDNAVASLNGPAASRKSRADLPSNNRQLRSKGPGREGKQSGGRGSEFVGRGGQPVGRGGQPGGRVGQPGGRGGQPGGRGGQANGRGSQPTSGRGGQPAGKGRGAHGSQKASDGPGAASINSLNENQGWQDVINGAPKGEVVKSTGLLPNDNDLARSRFNADS